MWQLIYVTVGGVSAAVSKTAAAPIERVKLLIQNQVCLGFRLHFMNFFNSDIIFLNHIYTLIETEKSALYIIKSSRPPSIIEIPTLIVD